MTSDQLVVPDEFHRVFEREFLAVSAGCSRPAGRAHVGELLFRDRVDHQIVVGLWDADQYALRRRCRRVTMNRRSRPAARTASSQPRCRRPARSARRYDGRDVTAMRGIAVEDARDQKCATRQVHEFVLEADQAPRRNAVFRRGHGHDRRFPCWSARRDARRAPASRRPGGPFHVHGQLPSARTARRRSS